MNKNNYPWNMREEEKNNFKPYKTKEGKFVIELYPFKYLHWIERTNGCPVTVSNPSFCMVQYNFIEEAEAIISYLKRYWSSESADINEKLEVKCKPLTRDQLRLVNVTERIELE